MPIYYRVVARKSPISGETKYYPQRYMTTRVTFEELCELVSHATTATYADCLAIITECVHQAKNLLLDSNSVEIGNMGTLHTTLSTIGEEAEEDVSDDDIIGVNVHMRMKGKFKSYLQKSSGNVSFKKLRVEDALRMLGLTPDTIRELKASGELDEILGKLLKNQKRIETFEGDDEDMLDEEDEFIDDPEKEGQEPKK